ncbi:LysR substrate-binding domain-containing protein, partial [Yersinia pestis]
NHPQGQLKITCSIAFGVCHLMHLFSQYKETNSDVCLSVDLNDQLVNLNEEHFDIALRITSIPPPNFAIRRICTI